MIKKIIYIVTLLPMFAIAQSTDQNWVKSKTYKQATTTAIATPTAAQAVTQVSYLDALGRPVQIVAHAQSNSGKDIVTHIAYDSFGRQMRDYLPYATQSTSLNFNTNAGADVLSFYNTATYESTLNPFSEKEIEPSPLNRVLKQAAPGDAWKLTSGHEIKFDYQTNSANEVKLYKAVAGWSDTKGLFDITLTETAYYAVGQLYKTITKDENWTSGNNNTTQEFKNKEGQVILKRTFNNSVAHDTYYIYDQFGNLTYVIPPLVNTTISITQTVLDNMCYQYKYDYRNRLVEKKLPGKQWEFIVYDKLDRVVATGPAYNPYGASGENDKGWMLTKYDVFNRPVYTAWYNAAVSVTADRKTLQDSYNNASTYSESKTTSATTINGISTKYTNSVTPSTFILLTVNYYDNYDYPDAPTVPTTLPDSTFPIATNVKGMPTGSWVRVLDVANSTTNELSYTIYDEKFRPVRSYTKNYLDGYTQVDSKIDWAGKTEYTLTKHKRSTSSTELVTKDMFEYSAQDKLVKHKHKVNALPEQLLSLNTYDELGQLISKKVGGTDVTGATALQNVDYAYNIRGWLKSINNVNNLAPKVNENDLFAFKLSYNTPENGTPLYNGNISETFWRSDSDNVKRKYTYQYDNLNRLLEANYSKPNNSITTNNYMEHLTYDKGGNILTLKRNGDYDNDGSSVAKQIDDLDYIYDTNNLNLLKKVKDIITNNPQGFKDDGVNTADDFTYDANGNMTKDNNKNITAISYNHLNLPTKITFGANGTIEYIYNSVGQKVSKLVTDYTTTPVATYYLNGFQYENGVLKYFPTAEGYVAVSVGKSGAVRVNYVFNYTDHLGNVRLSYVADEYESDVLIILEENNYYAFGLKHTNYNSDEFVFVEDDNENIVLTPVSESAWSSYNYKFGNKELQEELGLNMYDFGARNYDPALGRWMNIDPLAEKSKRFSPYNYCMNNPIFFIDPDGMLSEDFINDMWNKSGNNTTWTNNDDGTFSSNTNKTIGYQDGEKDKAVKARGAYVSMIKDARKDGHNLAADNLQRWLNGTGGTKIISYEWLRSNREIISGEELNQERFEEQLTEIGEGLADGESKNFSDYWDTQVTGGVFGELYYASGTSILTSSAKFKVTRKGDAIVISGSITHAWKDTYDWHAGATAYIPGYGNVDDSDALLVEKHCGAKPFEMQGAWKQTFNNSFKIGFFGGVDINLQN